MSLPLKDIRTAVDERTHAVLAVVAARRGLTISELSRVVLTEWMDAHMAMADAVNEAMRAAKERR